MKGIHVYFALLVLMTGACAGAASHVEIRSNQLFVDGEGQPQLYGAELQYFRLRGGQGPNLPRDKVIELWNRALDRMVEAHMNAISFYIPWDFHEYAEGKFDFTGTADADGDGKADYPSRDLKTFLRLVQEHGIKHILVRPGPYINAEWGFLGFGAVPQWLHDNYPETHMQSSAGLNTKLYDYQNPVFREKSRAWLRELYNQVLKDYIGPGKPVDFLQLDNETNYMWQSLFNHDYSPTAKGRYRKFLQDSYGTLAHYNSVVGQLYASWESVNPPTHPGVNVAEDQDWYRFHDESIHEYLHWVRGVWEEMGVKEPTVLFTLAESYNASDDGLLPNYKFRNDPGVTGMMTVNLYPKTYEGDTHPLLNVPFKAEHDTKAAAEANQTYRGDNEEWAMGPEIQAGWWRGTPVSTESRKQTYLSVIGHGMKAMFLYYFNEGDNFGSDWQKNQVMPLYQAQKALPDYADTPEAMLPDQFWQELQNEVDKKVIVGIDARGMVDQDPAVAAKLYFDAPLDGNAMPGDKYAIVKDVGEKIIAPHMDYLARAVEMTDPVCLLKDDAQHVPSQIAGVPTVNMNSEWSAGLLGYLEHSGINPRILHWDLPTSAAKLDSCQVIVYQDGGQTSADLGARLKKLAESGAVVVNFLGESTARQMGFYLSTTQVTNHESPSQLTHVESGKQFYVAAAPLFHYKLNRGDCKTVLRDGDDTAAYRCQVGKGAFYQVGALFYDAFNSGNYAHVADYRERSTFLQQVLAERSIVPRVKLMQNGLLPDRVTAFGRQDPEGMNFWITAKNGLEAQSTFQITLSPSDVKAQKTYLVQDLFAQSAVEMTGDALSKTGIAGSLAANESTVYFVQQVNRAR